MSRKRYRHRNGVIHEMRERTRSNRLTVVNTCAKCGKPIEPEMLVVGSEFCADCVIDECMRNGDWEDGHDE